MFPQFDPSKMDPKVLMELSTLVQTLPPDMINRMQQMMHNSMAGFDTRKEMEEFEKTLPPDFREKLMTLMAGQMGAISASAPAPVATGEMDVRGARLTLLRAVAEGRMTPEDAERALFQ